MNSDLSDEAAAPHARGADHEPHQWYEQYSHSQRVVLSAHAHDDARKRTVNPRSIVEREWLVSELDARSL